MRRIAAKLSKKVEQIAEFAGCVGQDFDRVRLGRFTVGVDVRTSPSPDLFGFAYLGLHRRSP